MIQWSKGSKSLELSCWSLPACWVPITVSLAGVFHVTQKSCRCLTWGNPQVLYFRVEFSAWTVVTDLNQTCRNCARKGFPNIFFMVLRRPRYWPHFSHQPSEYKHTHVSCLCAVFNDLCGLYFYLTISLLPCRDPAVQDALISNMSKTGCHLMGMRICDCLKVSICI